MGLLDDIGKHGYRDDGSPPLVVPGNVPSMAEIALRVAGGEDRLMAARDLLDVAGRATDAELEEIVRCEPARVDELTDALLAGLAEHLCARRGLGAPRWSADPGRFLDRFWFVAPEPGFRAIALRDAPISLKRRGVLWPARSLERV